MKNTIRSWLCLLLALTMALTAAGVSALAAEPADPAAPAEAAETEELPVEKPSDVILTRVEIELDTPEYNATYTYSSGGNNTWAWSRTDGVRVKESYWYLLTNGFESPDRFGAGEYFAELYLVTESGYRFPSDPEEFRLYVNGVYYDPTEFEITDQNHCYISTRTHPTAMVDISLVDVYLPLPLAGGSHSFVSGGNGADASTNPGIEQGAWIARANWYDDSLPEPEKFSTFQAGKTYRADVAIYAESGHGFPKGTIVRLNGNVVVPTLSEGTWWVNLDPYYYTIPSTAPVIKTIANTASGVKLTWSAGVGAVKYAIYRKAQGESKYSRISISSGTSYTDKSAVNGTYYYYRIWGMNASNQVIGDWSSARGITCQRSVTPAIASIANTGSGVKLTWGAVSGVAKYAIYRKAAGESKYSRISITSGTAYTDKSAANGTYYYYRIWSMNSSNVVMGEWSSARAITCVKSVTPTITGISNTGSGVKVTWGAVPGVAKYAIYRKASNESKYTRISITTAASYTDKSAADGTYYYYRIWSMDSANKVQGEWSTARGITCSR